MNRSAAIALLSLLATTAWSQTPAAETPAPAERTFDLSNDSIKKVVRDTAATQFADARVTPAEQTTPRPEQIQFVTPDKPPAEPKVSLPPPREPRANDFVAAIVGIAFDELTGRDEAAEIESRDAIQRCRVRKEFNMPPLPGTDLCPQAD